MNALINYQSAAQALYNRSQEATAFAAPPQALADQGPALSGSTAVDFLFAGNATFTVTSLKTGVRYTYKVRKAEDKPVYFVMLLTGSDNESDFSYLGMLGEDRSFRLTKASKLGAHSKPVVAFDYTLRHLTAGGTVPGVELHHAGRCGRCGRKLTVPSSVESGMGPECAQKGMAA